MARISRDVLAELLAAELLAMADGDIEQPETWLQVARRMDCIVFGVETRALAGSLVDREGRRPVLVYSRSREPVAQARIIVHELTHWILRGGYCPAPPLPYVMGFDWRGDDHGMARRVERMIFGKETRQ